MKLDCFFADINRSKYEYFKNESIQAMENQITKIFIKFVMDGFLNSMPMCYWCYYLSGYFSN